MVCKQDLRQKTNQDESTIPKGKGGLEHVSSGSAHPLPLTETAALILSHYRNPGYAEGIQRSWTSKEIAS